MPHIIETAEKVFGLKGFSGATIAEIARAADLPKANIHYYFSTKEALYRAVLERTLTGWLSDADQWLSEHHDARTGLRGYIHSKLAFSRVRPHASHLFAHEVLQGAQHIRPYLETTLRKHVQGISRTLDIWMERGEIPKADPFHFMFCLWAMTQTYADMTTQILCVLDKDVLTSEDFDAASETILSLVLSDRH